MTELVLTLAHMKTAFRSQGLVLLVFTMLSLTLRIPGFGATEIVSVSTGGEPSSFSPSRNPAVCATGRWVAFDSASGELVSNDQLDKRDVFVRDRLTGETMRASVGIGGEANDDSTDPAISADGRFVVFTSSATNLASSDTNGVSDIFVFDRQTGKILRASVATGGTEANGSSFFPAISGNGRFVAFISSASNLVSGDTNGQDDAFVHDLVTRTTTRVSVRSDGVQTLTVHNFTGPPDLNHDGQRIVFTSSASDLVSGDTNGVASDIFLHDRVAKTTVLASVTAGGAQANAFAADGNISDDGHVIAFVSTATNLPGGNGQLHVFVRDLRTGVVSRPRPSATYSYGPRLSADGSRIAMVSKVAGTSEQVEIVDRTSAKVFMPARFPDGTDAGNSSGAGVSADGRVAVFVASANGIVAADTNNAGDVFARQLFDTISFSKTAYYAPESDANAQVVVKRDGVLNGAVTVQYAVSAAGDTAIATKDYNAAAKAGTLTWPAGDSTDRILTFPLINTSEGDGYRFFTVALTSPTGGAATGNAETKVVIRDTESDPVENRVGHGLKITRIESRGTNWDSGLFRALFTIKNPAPLPSFPGFIEFRFDGNVIANANFDSVPANGELVVDAVASLGNGPDGDVFALLFETTDNGAVLQDSGFAAGFFGILGSAPPEGGVTQPNVGLKAPDITVPTIKSIVIEGPANVNEGAFADYTAKVTLSDNTILANVTPGWRTSFFNISGAGRFTASDVAADKPVQLTATVTRNGVAKTATRQITVKNVPTTPIITSSATASATRGKPFTYRITARHEATSFDAIGLPAGLSVNTSTGTISGAADTAGPFAVQIKATNTIGTDTNPLTLTVFEPSPLTIQIAGNGTVSPDPNGQLLDVGKTYKLIAKPGTGQIFAGWSHGITSLFPTLQFVMVANLVLDATFVANPFPTRSGSYTGIITSVPASHAAGGLFQAKITSSGLATGKIVIGGKPVPFKTSLRADGQAPLLTLKRPGVPSVLLTFQLDVAGTGKLSGSITNGPLSATFDAYIAAPDAALAGPYTITLPGPDALGGNGNTPDGSGFATARISTTGLVKIAGVLGDGTPFATSGSIVSDGYLPIYAPLYGGSGSIAGMAEFSNLAASDFSTLLAWFKPARLTDKFYPEGWPAGLTQSLLAARYEPSPVFPGLGVPDGDGNAMTQISGGGIPGVLNQTLNLSANGFPALVAPPLQKFKLTIKGSTGLFSGTFFDPSTVSTFVFAGAVQQKLQLGQGLFRGIEKRTGAVLIESNSP